MKKIHLNTALIAIGVVLLASGCEPMMYAQNSNSTYPIDNTDNGYNYDNGYSVAPPPEQLPENYNYNADNADYSNQPTITYDNFYTQLAPYGQWITDPTYGRVWIPNVANFQPYSTNGYWTYTNYGWTWVSNYNWGWAPFHYGRWGYSSRGWFWVPGYSWGPAWVAWSTGSDVYGWAPLAPGLRLSVGISINSIPANYWTFMPSRYMGYNNIHNYYEPRTRNVTIIRNTTIINNYGTVNGGKRRYTMGPKVNDVERATGRTFKPSRIVNSRDPKSAITERNVTETRRGASINHNNNNNRTINNNSGRIDNTTPRTSINPPRNNTVERANPPARNVETPTRTTTNPPTRSVEQRNTRSNNARTIVPREVAKPTTTTPTTRTYTETPVYRPQVKRSSDTRPINRSSSQRNTNSRRR